MVASEITLAVGDGARSISPFALRSSSFWRWLRCPLRPGKRRVNPIPVGFTPTPADTAPY
jgi:hypothetical protein